MLANAMCREIALNLWRSVAQRAGSGPARERSQIRLPNQTRIEAAGHTPQVFHLLGRKDAEHEPSNLLEVNWTRCHQALRYGDAHDAAALLPKQDKSCQPRRRLP
jgi:hypothetical protein